MRFRHGNRPHNKLIPRSMGHRENVILKGDNAHFDSTGHHLRLASVDANAKITSSEVEARIASAGMHADVQSTSVEPRIAISGHGSKVKATGRKPYIACAGQESKVETGNGAKVAIARHGAVVDVGADCVVVFAEPPNRFRVGSRSRVVVVQYPGHPGTGFLTLTEGENIKSGQWYMVRDAELIETNEE